MTGKKSSGEGDCIKGGQQQDSGGGGGTVGGDEDNSNKIDSKSGCNTGNNGTVAKLPLVFSTALREHPPPVPPQLLRKLSCKDSNTGVGKVGFLFLFLG